MLEELSGKKNMLFNQNKFRSGCFWHYYTVVSIDGEVAVQRESKKNGKKVGTDKVLSLGRWRYWEWLAFTGKQMA